MGKTNREYLFKTAELKLYEYTKLKAFVKEKEDDLIYQAYGKWSDTERVKSSGISKHTERGGVKLADDKKIANAKRWIKAIESAWAELEALNPQRAKLMVQTFRLDGKERGKKGFVREKLMDELAISMPTYYLWKKACVDDVIFYYNAK